MEYKNFSVRDGSTDISIIQNVYENDEYKAKEYIKKGDIVLDIGAHIGSFTVLASELGATVYSFEPVSSSFNLLKENVEKNNSTAKIFNLAIKKEAGEENIYIRKVNFGGSGFYTPHNNLDFIEKVVCVTPTQILSENNINHINFLKLDCEDSELEILENIDIGIIDVIAVEYVSNERRNKILDRLKSFDIVSDKHNDIFGTIIFKKK